MKEEKNERKEILLAMRTLRISSLNNFPIYYTAALGVAVLLDVTSPVLICLMTASLYLLPTFLQLSLPLCIYL